MQAIPSVRDAIASRGRRGGRVWPVAVLAAVCAALLSPTETLAQCNPSGLNQTCTNPAGTAVAGGGNGIFDGGTLRLTNFGSVTGTSPGVLGVTGNGIFVQNTIATNSGTITGGQAGIWAIDSATVSNSGTISGRAFGGIVVSNSNSTAVVDNSGTVSGGFYGVTAAIATVTNSGSISGGGVGVSAQTGSVTNSGMIAGGTWGIVINGTVTNSGIISGGTGITARGFGPMTLVNSGAIIGNSGTAIDFSLSHADTLSFLPGSWIQGAIVLGANDNVTVTGGRGPSSILTVTPTGPFTLNAGGSVPFAISGNQVATLDPTPFALADKTLMDFTRGISSILGSLGDAGAAPGGPVSAAFAPSDTLAGRLDAVFAEFPVDAALGYAGDAMVFKNPTRVAADGRSVWARGFGGERIQDADGTLLRSNTVFAGGAAGLDMVASPDLRLGAFVGGGQSRVSIELGAGGTSTDTVFGGLYGRWTVSGFGAPGFLDVALHGGGSRNDSSRNVIGSLAGVQVATARYGSSYVSPELKYGVHLSPWSGYTLTPSLQLRYVAGFFDGYAESGSAANLTVASRTINDVEERGELELTRAMPIGADLLLASLHVGAIGIERAGDTTVDTVLLGASLPFVTPGRNAVAGAIGGGGLAWRARNGVSIFGAAEAIGFTDQSTVIDARGGVRVVF